MNNDINLNVKEVLLHSWSDKEGPIHGYGFMFELLLRNVVSTTPNPSLLEIGVWNGYSILAWDSLNIFSKIVGIDALDWKLDYEKEEIRKLKRHNFDLIVNDAYTHSMVDSLSAIYGGFDVIIDDGSHELESQIFFINEYFKLLNPNGFLICEDIYPALIPTFVDLVESLDLNIINLEHQYSTTNPNSIMIIRKKT